MKLFKCDYCGCDESPSVIITIHGKEFHFCDEECFKPWSFHTSGMYSDTEKRWSTHICKSRNFELVRSEVLDVLLNFNPDERRGCPTCGSLWYYEFDDISNIVPLLNKLTEIVRTPLSSREKQ